MFYLDKAISSSQYNSYLVIWVIASSISGNVSSGKAEVSGAETSHFFPAHMCVYLYNYSKCLQNHNL